MRNQVIFTVITAVLFFFIGLFFGQETTVVNNYYNTCCEASQEVVDTIYVQDSIDQKIIDGLMEINDELYHQVQVSNSQPQQVGGEELTTQITNNTTPVVVDQSAEVTVNMIDQEVRIKSEFQFDEVQTEEALPHLSDGKVEAKPLTGLQQYKIIDIEEVDVLPLSTQYKMDSLPTIQKYSTKWNTKYQQKRRDKAVKGMRKKYKGYSQKNAKRIKRGKKPRKWRMSTAERIMNRIAPFRYCK